jgi:hypothetical protein
MGNQAIAKCESEVENARSLERCFGVEIAFMLIPS